MEKSGRLDSSDKTEKNNNDAGRSWSSGQLSATGRASSGGQQAIRASKLMGSEISDSSGNRIGRIEDVILNPSSGRIDFAVISRAGQAGSTSSSGSNSGYNSSSNNTPGGASAGSQGTFSSASQSGTGAGTSTSSGAHASGATSLGGQLIPVPWSLLQAAASNPGYNSSSSSSSLGGSQSFTLTVDRSKLDSAPALNRGSWSEISQSGWSQRINSYYGVTDSSTGSKSTGASESPSGSSSSGSGSSQPDNSGGLTP